MGELLGSLLVPGSIGGAIALIIITLVKQRGADKVNTSKDQKEHIDRLKTERQEADDRADAAQARVDSEIEKRRTAEAKAAALELVNNNLLGQMTHLSQEVASLRAEVESLKDQLRGKGGNS